MRAFPCFRVVCLVFLTFSLVSEMFAAEHVRRGGSGAVVSTSASETTPATVSKGPGVQAVDGKSQSTRLSLRRAIAGRPLVFFPVQGGDSAARFAAAGAGYSLTLGEASLSLTSERRLAPAEGSGEAAPAANIGITSLNPVLPKVMTETTRLEFVGGDPKAKVEGLEQTASYANFFTGKDPSAWQGHVARYQRVRYTNLYPGIDLIYYGETHRRLEYDLVVTPGADPQQIRLRVSGNQEARIGDDGELELDGPDGMMRLDAPLLYQSIEHGKKAIAGGFVQLAKNEFGFKAAKYDSARPLIIDPKINLVYATYAGGVHDDEADDLVLDASGAAYVTGYTASQDFPVTGNALQQDRSNIGTYTYDAFLMKFDASGTLIFSTFLGGSQTDKSNAVSLDSSGNVYIAGYTQSSDFPVTSNAYQKAFGGSSDAFLSKLSNDGSQLLYSTYLGGSGDESISRMRVNTDGSLWVVGGASANGLPASSTAFQPKANGTDNAFVAKLQFDGNGNLQIPALTFLGGSNNGEEGGARDFDVDSSGNVYVTGVNQSGDFLPASS
jgi:Beta-propeller repeat